MSAFSRPSPRPNTLATAALDRLSDRRSEQEWIAEQWSAQTTVVQLVWRGTHAVSGDRSVPVRPTALPEGLGDPIFLAAHALTVDWRRYTVILESPDFRIRTYFEAGRATITAGDKRNVAISATPSPLRSEEVDSVSDALRVVAQFLADEIQ